VNEPLRIVFFGTPDFAVPSLRTIEDSPDQLVGLVCQPDKPAGRGRRLNAPATKRVAEELGLPVLQPDRVRSPEFLEALQRWQPDLIVVAAYGKILPRSVLQLPRHGCINVHASLLPRWRGAAPIQWAILHGDRITGITIMQMNEGMDAGDILWQRRTSIGAEETYGELQERLARLGAEALSEALTQLHEGRLQRAPQNEQDVTLAPLIRKEDGRVCWDDAAAQLERKVRAFAPWPSAFTELDGKRLKLHRAAAIDRPGEAAPGTVTAIDDGVSVATGKGTLVLREIQLEGRKRMTAVEFARGGQLQPGSALG
jgi:methionyl-tRNA formyltransferase